MSVGALVRLRGWLNSRRGLTVLLAGVAGCATIPHRQPVPPSVPEQFAAGGLADGSQARVERWWESMGDTTLNRLVEQALADNLTLKGAYCRLAQAQALARRQRAELFPAVNLQGEASRTEQSDNGPTRRDFSRFSAAAAASYELDLWGRLGSLSTAAALDREGSGAELMTAAISLSAQVASTYQQLVEQRAQRLVLDSQLQVNQRTLELVTLRFRRGQVQATELLRQQQLVESTQGEVALTESRSRVLEHALALLLGRSPQDTVWAGARTTFADLPAPPAAGLPAALIQRRPDIQRAYLALAAADQRVAAAVAARFPRLSVSAQGSTTAEDTDQLFHNWITQLVANLALPLFDAGQRRAEVARTRASAQERLYGYEQAVLRALGEVEDALVREARQRQYVGSLERQLALSERVIVRVQDRHANGAASYLQVLDARRTYQQLQRGVLAARRQLMEERISLHRALAGGWEMSPAAVMLGDAH